MKSLIHQIHNLNSLSDEELSLCITQKELLLNKVEPIYEAAIKSGSISEEDRDEVQIMLNFVANFASNECFLRITKNYISTLIHCKLEAIRVKQAREKTITLNANHLSVVPTRKQA